MHNRKLKQYKIITLALTYFGSSGNHHQGVVLCLAKTTKYGFFVLVSVHTVNVMGAYQPVVWVCSSWWRKRLQSLSPPWTACPHNRLICCHNADCVYTDEHKKNHTL